MFTMSPEKKSDSTRKPSRDYRRELKYLYARKSAVDAVIESLEAYDRYRAASPKNRRRKTA
jgi:hypothetical protein